MKSNRIGLSEYTARRLAELKARRAEADDTGAFSSSSATTATAAAEASVNDSHTAAPSPSTVEQHPPTPAARGSSSADSNTIAVPPATQPPSKSDLHSSANSHTAAASHGTSTSTLAVAVSNGISENSPATPDTTSRHKQLPNESKHNQKTESNSSNEPRRVDKQDFKPESNPSSELRRIDKQDISSVQAVSEPSKPAVQHHELPRPVPYMRSAPHSNKPTSISASAVEVGALSKMASFYSVFFTIIWLLCFLAAQPPCQMGYMSCFC